MIVEQGQIRGVMEKGENNSLNRQTKTCKLLIFLFIKTYLKLLKTLLHVSVIRPSSAGL